MKNQRVAVTGGAGFIGSNLAEELARENEVIIIDNLSTGKMENIKELIRKDNVTFIHGSITDLELLQKSFAGIDCVFHLAALPSVPESIKDPISSNNININGTLNVLVASKDNHVNRVVFSSSCAVYGDPEVLPVAENARLNPKSPYAIAKLTGEYYCEVFNRTYGLSTISLRYFNVYGLRQDPKSEYAAVIPKFISSIKNGKSPVIFGDGLQTRDFVFIKDVVKANILAAGDMETGVFNIGTGVRITINELAGIIVDILGKNIKPLHAEPREGDIQHSYADISRAKAIGYEPAYSLEKGLRETIKFFSG